jgi:hypothetical protein
MGKAGNQDEEEDDEDYDFDDDDLPFESLYESPTEEVDAILLFE